MSEKNNVSQKNIVQDRWLLLFGVVLLLSIALHGFTFYLLVQARQQAAAAVSQAQSGLQSIGEQTIVTVVEIDQELPFSTTLPLNHTFAVPIDTVYPLSTVVETEIQIPLLGPQEIAVPIKARIPVELTVDIPVATEIPISLTYHLQTEVPVEVKLPSELLTPIEAILQQAEEAFQ